MSLLNYLSYMTILIESSVSTFGNGLIGLSIYKENINSVFGKVYVNFSKGNKFIDLKFEKCKLQGYKDFCSRLGYDDLYSEIDLCPGQVGKQKIPCF